MKHREAPACPRCNRNDEVRQYADDLEDHEDSVTGPRSGYKLAGTVIRPENPDWYCGACAATFGAEREYWGKSLTDRLQ